MGIFLEKSYMDLNTADQIDIEGGWYHSTKNKGRE